MKRLLTVIVALSLLLTSLGLSAFAAASDDLKFEGESTPFSVTDDTGKTTTVNKESKWAWSLNLGISESKPSGKLTYFRSGGVGGTVDFKIELAKGGSYGLVWAFRPNDTSFSTVQVLVNGTAVGSPVSLKTGDTVKGAVNKQNIIRTVDLGDASFKAGENTVSFKIVEMGAAANDKSALTVDYFRLVDRSQPEPEPEPSPVEKGRYEAEDTPFTVTDKNGKTTTENKTGSLWAWNLNLTPVSGASNKVTYFRSGGIGGTVDFKINVAKAGKQSIVWAYRPSPVSYSTVQVLVNGKEVGGVISLKSGRMVGGVINNSSETIRTVTLGNYDFKEGENIVTFKLVENGASEEDSALTIDYFQLGEPVDDSTLTFTSPVDFSEVKTKENSTPITVEIPDGMLDSYPGVKDTPKTTDKITVYPLADCYEPSKQYTLTVDGVSVPVTSIADQYEYAAFDYDPEKGSIEVKIECTASIRDLTVSPQHKNPVYKKDGKVITMTVSENQQYALCIGGKYLIISADPMQTDVPAESGEGIFNITVAPYSVDPSKMTDKKVTEAIQKALDDASAYGSVAGNKNGVVYIPAGVYYVGDLVVSSNTYLYLAGGAVFRITDDSSLLTVDGTKTSMVDPNGKQGVDYTWWISTAFEEVDVDTVNGSYDIKIGGRGTLDGRDAHYWDTSSEGNHSVGQNTVVPIGCSYFMLEGLTIRDAVCWSVVAVRSDHLTFDNLKFLNRIQRHHDENDGIDICECQDVVVKNCIGFAMDDPFSAKTWPYKTGITINWPGAPEYLSDVTFENCMSYTHRMGFKIGQGTDQNHYNVTFKNCTVIDATIGFGVHCSSGSGTVNGVVFDTIYVEKIHSGGFYGHTGWMLLHVQQNSRGKGNLKDVVIKNIYVYKGAEGNQDIRIHGYNGESGIDMVTFTDIYFDGVKAKTLEDLKPGLSQNLFAYNVMMKNTEDAPDDPIPPETDDQPEDTQTPDDSVTPDGGDDMPNTPDDQQGKEKSDSSLLWIVVVAVGVVATVVVVAVLFKKRKR